MKAVFQMKNFASRVTGKEEVDGREEEIEEDWCQDTALLHPFLILKNSDWSSPATIVACIPSCNCCRMERNLGGTPSLESCFQSIFAEVHEGYVKVLTLLSALIQLQPQDKDHVSGGSSLREATLCFWNNIF